MIAPICHMRPAEAFETLQAYGAQGESVCWLDKLSARNLAYSDLIRGVRRDWESHDVIRPLAIVENEGTPLLYVVAESSLGEDRAAQKESVRALRGRLACRGEPAWLAVLRPGQLTVYGLGPKKASGVAVQPSITFLQDLVLRGLGETKRKPVATTAFHNLLYKLITQTSDELLDMPQLSGSYDDVLSLVGRALFVRFLVDRGTINSTTFWCSAEEAQRCFDSAEAATRTCGWLDDTFNGDLLPLAGANYADFFAGLERSSPDAFRYVGNILRHAPDGQLTFEKAWGDIDFAHVPVGLLSEVYEQFAHRHAGDAAKIESIHYTPRRVAEILVDQAFPGISTSAPHEAKILDPAAGGGVLLTLAYRRLIGEFLKAHDRQPDRAELREILYRQIQGFDINQSALRLSALSLYLTAMEFDPEPSRPGGLSFKPLQGTILKCVRGPDEQGSKTNILGSLGPMVEPEFDGQFDLVISNPPWTAWKKGKIGEQLNAEAGRLIRSIAEVRAKGLAEDHYLHEVARQYENPDRVPDLAFVWRATQWAKSDGLVAMALHGRLLFKNSDLGRVAREAVFSSLHVTGVLNAAALRKEPGIWPGNKAHWCLLFGKNTLPDDDSRFTYVSPEFHSYQNRQGRIRVDYADAEPIDLATLRSKPDLLKTLFRGTWIDAHLIRRLKAKPRQALGAYWQEHGLANGIGLQVSSQEQDARCHIGKRYLHDFESVGSPPILKNDDVGIFDRERVHRVRDPAIYLGPVVMIPQSIDPYENRYSVYSSDECVFNRNFIGYSCKGHPEAELLAKYLFLVTQTDLPTYFALMTSSQYGVERDAVLTEDLNRFPIMPLEALSHDQCEQVQRLFSDVSTGKVPRDKLNGWAQDLYGISDQDWDAIQDAISTAMTRTSVKNFAEQPPPEPAVQAFSQQLREYLNSYTESVEAQIDVQVAPQSSRAWVMIELRGPGASENHDKQWENDWLASLADNQGATQIIVQSTTAKLMIGLLNENRYLTKTRARFVGNIIVREHSDFLLDEHYKSLEPVDE